MATKSELFPAPFNNEYSERVVAGLKATTLTSLDAYDRAVTTLAELHVRLAEASQINGLKSQAKAQADLVRELNAAFTKAARTVIA